MKQNIYEVYENIQSQSDFEYFLKLLVKDFSENKESWENDRLELFLEGLYGYNFESEKNPIENPSWKVFAEMLLAAKVYE